MNTFAVVLCAALITIASGNAWNSHHEHGYQPGFRNVPYGIQAPYNNAVRQLAVNHQAEHVGASSGTAKYYGVPGSGKYFGHRGYKNFGFNNGYIY